MAVRRMTKATKACRVSLVSPGSLSGLGGRTQKKGSHHFDERLYSQILDGVYQGTPDRMYSREVMSQWSVHKQTFLTTALRGLQADV